jgi:hypothetical protein
VQSAGLEKVDKGLCSINRPLWVIIDASPESNGEVQSFPADASGVVKQAGTFDGPMHCYTQC